MASRQALLGKDIHSEPSLHVQELLAPPEYTHHGQLPGQTEIRWAWFQTVPFPEVLAPSLHQAKSCKKECWRFANNAIFGFLKKSCYIVHMASLSLFELFGLSFARTGKNGDFIACASRKNFCSNCREESPQWPPKQMASRQALLGKDIHSGHWVQLACSGVAGTISKTKMNSGWHSFKLHRSCRCWIVHSITAWGKTLHERKLTVCH